MNKEQLIEYVNLYNQFQRNPNMQFTNEQINLINEVHKEAQNNQALATFLSNTAISTEVERMNALNAYLNEPMSANYHDEQINVSDRVDTTYTESEQYNNLQSDFEDKPELNQTDEFEQLSEDMKEQIKKYNEYPELLQMLPEEEQQMWSYYVDVYEQKLAKEEELQNQQHQTKVKKFVKQDKNSGFADVLLLSLITGFLGGVLTTLTTLLLTK